MNIFSLKNKTKQKYSSGELSIREKSEIIFKFVMGVRMERGQVGRCSVTGDCAGVWLPRWVFSEPGGSLLLPHALLNFTMHLFCTICFFLSFSSLCLCLLDLETRSLSFSLESKTFSNPSTWHWHPSRWSVDHRSGEQGHCLYLSAAVWAFDAAVAFE